MTKRRLIGVGIAVYCACLGTVIGLGFERWEHNCTRIVFFGHDTGWLGRRCAIPKELLDVDERRLKQMQQETFKLLCKFEVCT